MPRSGGKCFPRLFKQHFSPTLEKNTRGCEQDSDVPCAPFLGRGKGKDQGALPRGEEDPSRSCSSQQEHPADAMPVRLFAILGCGFLSLFS